jgi:hypothetical protein
MYIKHIVKSSKSKTSEFPPKKNDRSRDRTGDLLRYEVMDKSISPCKADVITTTPIDLLLILLIW